MLNHTANFFMRTKSNFTKAFNRTYENCQKIPCLTCKNKGIFYIIKHTKSRKRQDNFLQSFCGNPNTTTSKYPSIVFNVFCSNSNA